MEIKFRIFRFDPEVDEKPRYQNYVVSAEPEERILDCLNRIRWEQDGTLSYRMSCAHGVCGSDGMKINGTCGLACQKLVKDYMGTEVVLEPLPFFRVLKDLIVDMEPFFEGIKFFQPYLISSSEPPEKERKQSQDEMRKIEHVIRCIMCGSCTGACPVMLENPKYVGPAALVWAYRYIFESRDDQHMERLKTVDFPDGVWSCVNYFECTRVCPKNIPVTKSINLMKREIEKAFGDNSNKKQD
jgi:succinate dehydrogenase / fumarate reductase, iron-sulfur subunit